MDDDTYNIKLTIAQLIEIELCGIDAVIDTIGPSDCDPVFIEVRNRLATLLNRHRSGEVAAEYAEVEFQQIKEHMARWDRDHPLPPDWND